MGGLHDIRPSVKVVEHFFVWLGTGSRDHIRPRRVVPVSWDADGLDISGLGPLLDAPGDEFWLGFAPDACGAFGFGDRCRVRGGLDRPDSGGGEHS